MHIPENYLSPSTCAVMTAAMLPVWTYSIKKVKAEIPKVKMPLLGIGAAFSFLGMMFNIPLPGGTTGHAVGGTLIAILTGSPSAGCIAVTIALLIQALLFGDGGILAFGANCFNMAFMLPFIGFALYKFIWKKTGKRKGRPLDFMGFQFYHDKTILRESIMLSCTRKVNRVAKKEKITWYDATAILSYMGYLSNTDTYDMYLQRVKPYVNVKKLKKIVSKHSKRKEREKT